jgi:hypothetical protein
MYYDNNGDRYCDKCDGSGTVILNAEGDWEECDECENII